MTGNSSTEVREFKHLMGLVICTEVCFAFCESKKLSLELFVNHVFKPELAEMTKNHSVSINLHFPETALLWHFKNVVLYKHSETFFF